MHRLMVLLVIGGGCVSGNPDDSDDSVSLHIEIDGDGVGFVRLLATGQTCSTSCDLAVPRASGAVDGTIEWFTPDLPTASCTSDSYYSPTRCYVNPVTTPVVSVTFAPRPELTSVMLDHSVTALGVTANGDLVAGTETGIERLSPAGATIWTQSIGKPTSLVVGADDSILLANPVSLRHGDGTLAWQSAFTASDIALGGGGRPAIITSDARVVALDPATGAEAWSTAPLGVTSLAVSSTGQVTAAAGTTLVRFDAAGNRLADITTTREIERVAIDPDDRLVVSLVGDPPSILSHPPIPGALYDASGALIGALDMSFGVLHGRVATRGRVLGWGGAFAFDRLGGMHPGGLAAASLAPGSPEWSVFIARYAGDHFAPDLAPERAACNRERRCVIAGVLGGAPVSQWLGVFTLP